MYLYILYYLNLSETPEKSQFKKGVNTYTKATVRNRYKELAEELGEAIEV